MPSQLLTNDKISFIVCKPFSSRGKDYEVGDDFPQEEARDIEVFVRARFVKPCIESAEDKVFIKQWHNEIRTRAEVMETLTRDRAQLVWPTPPDSDEVVNLDVLTHPETTPEVGPESGVDEDSAPAETEAEADGTGENSTYDPGEHTVAEVEQYLAEHPEETEAVLAAERAGRARKGLVGE